LKPIKANKFRKLLKSLGLVHVRTKGSHEIWDKPNDSLDRPVVLVSNLDEVPVAHIKTNLSTLGIDIKDLEEKLSKL